MVIADFFVISVAQKDKSSISEMTEKLSCSVDAHKIPIKKVPILGDEHFFAQNLRGYWYSFYPSERIEGNYSLEWFDIESKNKVKIIQNNMDTILEILNECFKLSPVGYCAVLFRLQAKPKEKIIGTISRKKYIKLLLQNQLQYNCLYIVK